MEGQDGGQDVKPRLEPRREGGAEGRGEAEKGWAPRLGQGWTEAAELRWGVSVNTWKVILRK